MRTSHVWIIAAMIVWGAGSWPCPRVLADELSMDRRPNDAQWIFDQAGLVAPDSAQRLHAFLNSYYRDADIEFVAVMLPGLNGDEINAASNRIFENWDIGKKTRGNKGLLLVVAVNERQVRLEVGSDLEGIFTDAFTGYIEQEQMKPFFEQGRVADGFEATLELIVSKTWESIELGDYNPEQAAGLGGTEFRSTGGGARRPVDIGSRTAPDKPVLDGDQLQVFRAQSSPEATLNLYFEAARRHVKDPNLGIYTDETKAFFRNWTVTNAQQDSERQYENVPFQLKIEGDSAVIYYPDKDWTYNPFFLRRNAEGWQLDFATMSKVIRFNHRNYWHFVDQRHPYMFAFRNYHVDENGFVWYKRTKQQRGFINISFPWSKVPMEIRWVAKGGSADRQGVKVGDVITHINGKDVKRIGFAAAVNEAVGAIGTTLDITVYRPSQKRSMDFTITREEERF